MVLILIQWILLKRIISLSIMVKFSTKLSLGFSLEIKRAWETARIISKVLRVSKETILTRLRKQT